MTLAQEWIQEGEIKGKIEGEIKGRIETIESLLNVGVDWHVIEQATGIDQAEFRSLKERLAHLVSEQVPQSTPPNGEQN